MDGGVHCGGGSRHVVTELGHIKELVTQLEVHLAESPDLCKHLASQIFSLAERSIRIITSSDFKKRSAADAGLASAATPSLLSDAVDAPFKTNKRSRKMMEKSKHQVRVSPGNGEAITPVDDGHSWRKYGQKEILGAKHPRGYYRCTHRHSQGCAATKQVQRTDEDPNLFDVIYLGTHTCVHNKTAALTAGGQAAQPPTERNPEAHALLQNLSANLTVNTEGLAAAGEPQGWGTATATPLCFSSTSVNNWGVSPATSDSNRVSPFHPFEAADWRAQSELQEVVSALVAAGAPSTPAFDMDEDFVDIDISSFFV